MTAYALLGGQYFQAESKEMIDNFGIIIEDGKISRILRDGELVPEGTEIIDITDKFVIPGLIDSHIHFFQSGGLFTRPDGLDLRHVFSYEEETKTIKSSIPELFKRYIATGITGVVDDGGPLWNKEVFEESKKADIAPHVTWAGPLVSTVSREKLDLGDPPIIKAESEDHARQLVDNCLLHNPHYVKFWYIYLKESFENDSKIMKAGITYAREKGARVMVHATELETAKRAVQYGANILVHSVFDSDIDEEFITLCKERNVIYIPTLMVRKGYFEVYHTNVKLSEFEQLWGDPRAFQTFRRLMVLADETVPEPYRSTRKQFTAEHDLEVYSIPNLRRLVRAGVRIASGTDAGNVGTLHGPSLHYEMEVMTKAMSPADVLIATTVRGAEVMGRDDIGKIDTGIQADLVILTANPLDDIKNTRAIDQVVLAGKRITPTDLITPMTPHTLVMQQVEAYNHRDIGTFLETYHPRVVIEDLKTGEILMDGIDDMRSIYSDLFDSSPDLHAEIISVTAYGNTVVHHERVNGTMGSVTAHDGIAIYLVEEQLITHVWFS